MKKLIILTVMLFITACSTAPPLHRPVVNPGAEWQQRQKELIKINDWLLNGRVAIINGHESWHLTMNWQRHGDKYILDLSGPFGAGHAQLTGTKDGVMLVDADKNYSYAESPDRLLAESTGLRLPVKSLLYWMRGLPDGTLKKHQLDEFGRLAQLQQKGWRVRFKHYIDVGKVELPQKIFIDGYDLTVKIFVDQWDLKSRTFQSASEE